MDEIASHMESGGEDPHMGTDQTARMQNTLREMGSPDDLGRGLRNVHRPTPWLEFAVIFVPAYLIFHWIAVLLFDTTRETGSVMAMVITLLLSMLLAGFSAWRRLNIALFFWLPEAAIRSLMVLFRQSHWLWQGSVTPEKIFWNFLIVALTAACMWIIWQNRKDFLLVAFGGLPFLGTLANIITFQLARVYPLEFHNPVILGIGLTSIIEVASLAAFVLLRNRQLRWLALLLGTANYTVMMALAVRGHPWLVAMYTIYTAVLLMMWWLDPYNRAARDMQTGSYA